MTVKPDTQPNGFARLFAYFGTALGSASSREMGLPAPDPALERGDCQSGEKIPFRTAR
jgi:hypothetical protein